MRWRGRRQSTNVDDRRSRGGGRGIPMGGRGMKLGGGSIITLLLVVVGIFWLLGGNPMALLSSLTGGGGTGGGGLNIPTTGPGAPDTAENDQRAEFISVVLADTEDVWHMLFEQMGRTYQEPELVLFRDGTSSGCGFAQSAIGPFYCPADRKVYIDLGFYDQLSEQLGAPGDFAEAYVVAHEVGHHVQNLLGITDQLDRARRTLSETEFNELSVKLELQADFLAGVWAHHAQRMASILEPGDLEEALRAAGAVGDDTLQRRSQGRVVPDSFTHGTSAQRIEWFRKGLETGDIDQGDTFEVLD